MGRGDRLKKWRSQKGCASPNPSGLPGRPKKRAEIGAMAREILGEEDRHGRTELERLIGQMLKRAHQGSFKHGEPVAVAQNLNVNAEMNQGEMTIPDGIPRPVWGPVETTIEIEAAWSEIRELLEKREAAKKPKALPVHRESKPSAIEPQCSFIDRICPEGFDKPSGKAFGNGIGWPSRLQKTPREAGTGTGLRRGVGGDAPDAREAGAGTCTCRDHALAHAAFRSR